MNFSSIRRSLEEGKALPELMEDWIANLEKIDAIDPAIWISRFPNSSLLAAAKALEAKRPNRESLPLFGIPFAVKDNIDVAGLPTTAACPAYSYHPQTNAHCVQRLLDAGAICIGKTNLDQFATGLTGTRSPYGIPKNPFAPGFIPGGSSSGSAVATARGLVAFALGTDTAGSGRVPAAFNNLVGWKPTRGLVSTQGVVPACRTLDCVSVFTNNLPDLREVVACLDSYDESDPFSRLSPPPTSAKTLSKIAIPLPNQLRFFGDTESDALWQNALAEWKKKGVNITETDFSPFFETANLLYDGPWLAERYCTTRPLLQKTPEALLPVTQKIISKGAQRTAFEGFLAQYRLAELRRQTDIFWKNADAIFLPTTGTIFSLEEIAKEPIAKNTDLGYYTNFVNLLDLCALALPAGFRKNGTPFGITLMAPAWNDLPLIELSQNPSEQVSLPLRPTKPSAPTLPLAVCGAHMSGLPLNSQLLNLGAHFVKKTSTESCYRMFALDEKRPGLVRVLKNGKSLPVEIWNLPTNAFGEFLDQIPSPLGLGKISLSDGSEVCGFLCESAATTGKIDITEMGGWRAWFELHSCHKKPDFSLLQSTEPPQNQ